MPGRLHSIVLPLDQGFPNRNFIIGEVFGYAQIYFPAYFNSLCQTYDYIGLIRQFQLGRLQGDAGEILGGLLGDSWEIGSQAKKCTRICISHLPDMLWEIGRLQQYSLLSLHITSLLLRSANGNKAPQFDLTVSGTVT